MKYVKYTINTTTNACEDISYMLTELGITAVEIEDNLPVDDEIQGVNYPELQPNMPEDDGTCRINYYLEEEDDNLLQQVKSVINEVSSYLDVGSGEVDVEVVDNDDYLNNWKEFFHAFEVGELLIKPTWDQVTTPKGGQTCISIDPGVSFGTGAHETTQLCIRGIQKYIKPGDEVLDLGFGSGILSLVALKLGAKHIVGTDIDPICVEAAYENFNVNNIEETKANYYIGDITGDKRLQEQVGYDKYDLVVANILADIIIPMAPVMAKTVKAGGLVVTSGIIDFKEQAVVDALTDAGLEIVEINHQGEWVNVTAKKN